MSVELKKKMEKDDNNNKQRTGQLACCQKFARNNLRCKNETVSLDNSHFVPSVKLKKFKIRVIFGF